MHFEAFLFEIIRDLGDFRDVLFLNIFPVNNLFEK